MATALTDAGHTVVYATSATYGPTIEQYGFESVPMGIDYTQGSVEFEDGDTDPIERIMFVTGPPVMLEDLTGYMASNRPDVVLVDPTESGSMVAAEASGIPWGALVPGRRTGFMPGFVPFQPSDRDSSFYYLTRKVYSDMRESVGLDPFELLPGEFGYDRSFSLCMAPESFGGLPLQQQHHTSHPIRPEIHKSDSDDGWLDDLADDVPLVAVSFGTLFGSSELYTEAARAVVDLDVQVVVATSHEVKLEHERLTTVRWVSMDRLMDRADVSVHHAGWGSTVAALATGTPSVAVPIGADQFTNSQAIQNTGAGLIVGREQVSAGLGEAVQRVLENPGYRFNAERLQREIEAMPPAQDCVPLVEELADKGVVFNKPSP